MDKVKRFIKKNWMFITGIILIGIYLYSKVVFEKYTLSFTNLMYDVSPWDSLNVDIKGPVLSDVVDNLYTTLYKIFFSGSGLGLWNSTVALGTVEDLSAVMYPLNYIYLLPFGTAILIKSILEFLIGFISMYLLMREFKVGKVSASISGITYTFASSLVMWHGWPHSDVAIFAPLMFLCIEKLIKEIKIKYILFFILILYTMLSAGMPTFAAYFLYLLGAYIVVKTLYMYWGDKKKIVYIFIIFAIGVIISVAMSLPYTGGLLNSVGDNGYSESRKNLSSLSLGLEYIRTIIFPHIRNGLVEHPNESTIYSGIISIILLIFTFIRYKKKKINFWTFAWIIVVCLIFTHIFDPIYIRLLAINTSLKYRVIVLLNFITSIIIGFNLDDILNNKEYYKSKFKYFIFTFLVGSFIICLLSISIKNEIINDNDIRKILIITIVIFISLITTLWLIVKYNKRVCVLLLVVIVALDLSGFTKDYLPLIKSRDIIPKATDSIKYLQENTTNNERIASIGDWTLFPNTNVYYSLRDIRSHNFITTNSDIKTYYKSIESDVYASKTRTRLINVDNYNLLKYLGVKYILEKDSLDISENLVVDTNEVDTIGEILSSNIIQQEFVADRDGMNKLSILFATYGKDINTDEVLVVKLIDKATNKTILKQKLNVSEIKDNQYKDISFNAIDDSKDNTYIIQIESNDDLKNAITIWSSAKDNYKGDLYINNNIQDKDIYMNVSYYNYDLQQVYTGEDDCVIGELNAYSDRVQLIENVFVKEKEKDVLDDMKNKYYENTLFITKSENQYKNSPITSDEYVDIVEDKDDYIKLDVNLEQSRYILLNDYYDKDWNVYVDGKQVKLEKGNYLMRAVFVEGSGKHSVEFKYEPKITYIFINIAICSFSIFILMCLFSRRLQKIVNRLLV